MSDLSIPGVGSKYNAQKVIDALMKKPEHKTWAEEARGADGNPDAADLKEAAEFAQAMVGKAY